MFFINTSTHLTFSSGLFSGEEEILSRNIFGLTCAWFSLLRFFLVCFAQVSQIFYHFAVIALFNRFSTDHNFLNRFRVIFQDFQPKTEKFFHQASLFSLGLCCALIAQSNSTQKPHERICRNLNCGLIRINSLIFAFLLFVKQEESAKTFSYSVCVCVCILCVYFSVTHFEPLPHTLTAVLMPKYSKVLHFFSIFLSNVKTCRQPVQRTPQSLPVI